MQKTQNNSDLPRPMRIFVSSLKESTEIAKISKYFPHVLNHFSVTFEPLDTIETDSNLSSSLQNLVISPMKSGYKNGSPPDKFSFLIPFSASFPIAIFASPKDATNEVLAVWKQKPHS